MTGRDEFIKAISSRLGRDAVPHKPTPLVYRHSVHTEVMADWPQQEIAAAFVDYSKTLGVKVIECAARQTADSIREAIADIEGDVLIADEPLLEELNLMQQLAGERAVKKWDIQSSRAENIANAEQAAVGIVAAEMALAESGTVMLFCSAGAGRSVSLLPATTIYLIRKSGIRPRLTQAMAHIQQQDGALPASINLVSGPSSTADIELVRVVGVHGPVAVVYVVIGDL